MNHGNQLTCRAKWKWLFFLSVAVSVVWGADEPKHRSNTELRRVSVVTDLVELGKKNPFRDEFGGKIKVDCRVEIHDGSRRPMSLEGEISLQGASNLRVSPKKNYRVKLTKGQKSNFLPIHDHGKTVALGEFVLRNPTQDSWLETRESIRREARYVNDLWQGRTLSEMGYPTQVSEWVHLFVNGTDQGLYLATEEPNAEFLGRHYGGDSKNFDVIESQRLKEGDLVSFNKLKMLVSSPRIAHPQTLKLISKQLDLDHFNDYLLVNIYQGNIDWPGKNFWLARERMPQGTFRFFSWDAEMGFFEKWKNSRNPKGLDLLDYDQLKDRNFLRDAGGAGFFYRELKKNPEYRLMFADRLYNGVKRGGVLSSERAASRYRDLLDEVEPLLEIEAARWGGHYEGEEYSPKSKEWKKLTGQDSWLFAIFFPKRSEDLIGDFRRDGVYPSIDPPEFSYELSVGKSSGSALLSLENPNEEGRVYYTLDGTDPRKAYTGETLGKLLSGKISLAKPTLVKARVKTRDEWSALQEIAISW